MSSPSPHKVDPSTKDIVLNAATPGTLSKLKQLADPAEDTDSVNLRTLAAAVAGVSVALSTVPVTTSPFAVSATTHKGKALLVSTAAARQLNLPSPATAGNGWYCYVKDASGAGAGTNNITLHRAASEQIEAAAADLALSCDRGFWTVFTDGTNWFITAPAAQILTA